MFFVFFARDVIIINVIETSLQKVGRSVHFLIIHIRINISISISIASLLDLDPNLVLEIGNGVIEVLLTLFEFLFDLLPNREMLLLELGRIDALHGGHTLLDIFQIALQCIDEAVRLLQAMLNLVHVQCKCGLLTREGVRCLHALEGLFHEHLAFLQRHFHLAETRLQFRLLLPHLLHALCHFLDVKIGMAVHQVQEGHQRIVLVANSAQIALQYVQSLQYMAIGALTFTLFLMRLILRLYAISVLLLLFLVRLKLLGRGSVLVVLVTNQGELFIFNWWCETHLKFQLFYSLLCYIILYDLLSKLYILI